MAYRCPVAARMSRVRRRPGVRASGVCSRANGGRREGPLRRSSDLTTFWQAFLGISVGLPLIYVTLDVLRASGFPKRTLPQLVILVALRLVGYTKLASTR